MHTFVPPVVEAEQTERHTWMDPRMKRVEIRSPAAWGPVLATVDNCLGCWNGWYSGTGIVYAGLEGSKEGIQVFAANMDYGGDRFPK